MQLLVQCVNIDRVVTQIKHGKSGTYQKWRSYDRDWHITHQTMLADFFLLTFQKWMHFKFYSLVCIDISCDVWNRLVVAAHLLRSQDGTIQVLLMPLHSKEQV